MSWLIRDGDVLAALEMRRPGWPAAIQGAVVLRGPVLVQTLTSRVALDVAWCAPDPAPDGAECLVVRRIRCLEPGRVARPHFGTRPLVVAGRGAFERWHLQVGDRLEIREV
jgi:hypothetical protein